MNNEQFIQALKDHGITISDRQMMQFDLYFETLVAANQNVNLTTITKRGDVFLKHFYDSLTPAFFVSALKTDSLSLCDVGAGAGFPSIPLKIMFPKLKITIVDSLNKRIHFLKQLIADLQLSEVTLFHSRAEEFGAKHSSHREAYDVVTARAVARLSVLSEFCLPLVKVGGKMIALKAAKAEDEIKNAKQALNVLGGRVSQDNSFELPVLKEQRHIIVIDKIKKTPSKYPRKAGTPAREPLGEN